MVSAKKTRMHSLCAAASVLVALHFDEGGLDGTGEARNSEGVHIRLAELIERTVNQHLRELIDRCILRHEGRKTGACTGGGHRPEVGHDVARRLHCPHELRDGGLEALFEPRPHREQVGIPLPFVRDVLDSLQMKLVEERQGQLSVVVTKNVVGEVGGLCILVRVSGSRDLPRIGRGAQNGNESGAQWAAGCGTGMEVGTPVAESRTEEDI